MGILYDVVQSEKVIINYNSTIQDMIDLNKVGIYPIIHSGKVVGLDRSDINE